MQYITEEHIWQKALWEIITISESLVYHFLARLSMADSGHEGGSVSYGLTETAKEMAVVAMVSSCDMATPGHSNASPSLSDKWSVNTTETQLYVL